MPTDSEGRAARGDWTFTPPSAMAPLAFDASFSAEEFAAIKRGVAPQNSDDKWFIYWHEETLWIHRAWTGFLIYKLQWQADGTRWKATNGLVSTDRAQYGGASAAYESEFLAWLIRYILLGDEKAEIPLPPGFEPDSEEPVRWTWLDTAKTRLAGLMRRLSANLVRAARPAVGRIMWRLTRPAPRLSDAEMETAIQEEMRAQRIGPDWRPVICWIADPAGAYVTFAHKDGPTHVDIDPIHLFVDRSDGSAVLVVAEDRLRAGSSAIESGNIDIEYPGQSGRASAAFERLVQVCLSGAHERYRWLPTE